MKKQFTQTKSEANKAMKISTKGGLYFLILGMLFAAPTLQAEKNQSDNTLKLTARQYSIGTADVNRHELMDYQEADGILSFRLLTGYNSLFDSHQLLEWIKNDNLLVQGIRFDADKAVFISKYRLDVPYTFESPPAGQYLETALIIEAGKTFDFISTPLSIYPGKDSIVELIRSDGSPVNGRLITSMYSVKGDRLLDYSQPVASAFSFAEMPEQSSADRQRKSFFFRNRYWLAGAATLAISSTTAMILNSGESVTYLPEPPGRP